MMLWTLPLLQLLVSKQYSSQLCMSACLTYRNWQIHLIQSVFFYMFSTKDLHTEMYACRLILHKKQHQQLFDIYTIYCYLKVEFLLQQPTGMFFASTVLFFKGNYNVEGEQDIQQLTECLSRLTTQPQSYNSNLLPIGCNATKDASLVPCTGLSI